MEDFFKSDVPQYVEHKGWRSNLSLLTLLPKPYLPVLAERSKLTQDKPESLADWICEEAQSHSAATEPRQPAWLHPCERFTFATETHAPSQLTKTRRRAQT
jgi:hypothetical protein